jgi:hypothetical protein
MSQGTCDPRDIYGPGWPYAMPSYPPLYQSTYQPALSERDLLAAACLPAIYANMTQLTDRAAVLAYEQADEMLKARECSTAAPHEGDRNDHVS